MEGKIYYSKRFKVFFLDSASGEMPIPPKYFLEGEFELKIRMDSSRGQLAAWWKAGTDARRCLNNAPFKPVFRGILSYFYWDLPGRMNYDLEPPNDVVVQGGFGVPNWRAKVLRPIEDKFKEFIESEILPREDAWEPYMKQGHLRVYAIYLDNIPYNRSYPYKYFYNHFIASSCDNFFYRVVGETAYGVLETSKALYILSADHPDEPIPIYRGTYLLVHPYPRGQD
jgi:hypothetical protein